MMNQVVIVGRIASDLKINEAKDRKVCKLILAVSRPYKNADGVYETDMLPIELEESIAENTVEYCKKGDIVGIKGRLEGKDTKLKVKAERVTFLSSKKEGE